MFITLLYVSAFLFFIADRKIKHSSLAGIAVIVFASLPFSYRTLYGGYRIIEFAEQNIPRFYRYDKNFVSVVFALFVSLIAFAVLLFIAKMWSREMFFDDIKGGKKARLLFIIASVIPGIIAVILYCAKFISRSKTFLRGYFLVLFDHIGQYFFYFKIIRYDEKHAILGVITIASTIYVVLLLAFSILCITLISRKNVSYKNVPASQESARSALPSVALTVSLSGVLSFMTVIQRGHIEWSSNYRRAQFCAPFYFSLIYGSYNASAREFYSRERYVFCMIVLGVMAVGIIVLLISLVYMAKKKMIRQKLFSFIFSIALIIISSASIYKMIKEALLFFSIKR
jgi:hypothetical protein